jgi:hypothetical protein
VKPGDEHDREAAQAVHGCEMIFRRSRYAHGIV